MKTSGDLRMELAKCFMLAKDGNLSGDALRGVIGCANQITSSLAVEMKARAQLQKEGVAATALGELIIFPERNEKLPLLFCKYAQSVRNAGITVRMQPSGRFWGRGQSRSNGRLMDLCVGFRTRNGRIS